MNFQIFGIPFVGTDICGFVGDIRTTPHLCARWYQLSVFYPLPRNNHQSENEFLNSQEPYQYEGIYYESIKRSIKLKYSLVKYFYTQYFLQNHISSTKDLKYGVVIKPLFFEFFRDMDSNLPEYGSSVYDEQFLIGKAILAAPTLYPKLKWQEIYMPNVTWYDLRDYSTVPVRGGFYNCSVSLEEEPAYFLREGNIFFKQNISAELRSTADLTNDFELIVGLSEKININEENSNEIVQSASGQILDTNYDENELYENWVLANCILNVKIDVIYHNDFLEIIGKSS